MDRDLLIIILVGGILTFGTYYYAYQSGKGLTLWAGVEPKDRFYYSISGIFAGLVFLYLFWYYVYYREKKTKEFKQIIDIAMGFITFGSAAWVPLTFLGLNDKRYKFLSILALLIVSIGSLLLVFGTSLEKDNDEKNSDKNTEWALAIAAGSIFAFHVTFLDLLSWGPRYITH
tara:strand:+ start:186 stop:704 length:519 start_codon:yes stop_codon:yes gene_type:complete